MSTPGSNHCCTGTFFFGYVMRILHSSDTGRVWVLEDVFGFGTMWAYIPWKNLHTKFKGSLYHYGSRMVLG